MRFIYLFSLIVIPGVLGSPVAVSVMSATGGYKVLVGFLDSGKSLTPFQKTVEVT